MESILRKSLLYRSGLGFYCVNHVQGCRHGCLYPCYAYMIAQSHGRIRSYSDWCQPKIVANAAELIKHELNRRRVRPGNIHLCLSTDPFMNGFPEVTAMSLRLISIINSFGISCTILTKGCLPPEMADRSRFPLNNQYGISLISLDENFRKTWEPGSVSYSERIRALRELHNKGCRTYVHMEPYPTPNILQQNLREILEAIGFADRIWFGRWNYNNLVRQYPDYTGFYSRQVSILHSFCPDNGIECDV
ncbi:MAG: radical SAM protein [Bacteroidota bacterium]|nr:radical SAM protein [Bacteroidota bacterium]